MIIIHLLEKKRIAMFISGAAALLAIVLLVQFGINYIPDIRDYIVEMNTLPAFLYGVCLFSLISTYIGERESKNAAVRELTRASFGIYIIHVIFLDLLTNIILPYRVFGEQAPALYLLVLYGLTFGCSYGAVFLLTRIKGMRKLFYYR